MTAPPLAPCPPALVPKALPVLAARVAEAATGGPSALLPILQVTLASIANARLAGVRVTAPLAPLNAFVSLASEEPVPLPLLCDALLAYPADCAALRPAVAGVGEEDLRGLVIALVHRLDSASGPGAPATLSRAPRTLLASMRLLHALLRTEETAASVILEEADSLVTAIAAAYALLPGDRDSVRAKAEALTFVRALAAIAGPGKSVLRSLLGPTGKRGTPLVDQSIADDYALFEILRPDDAQAVAVRALHDDERGDDPRLVPLQHLFPTLPAHLLADALAHPSFAAASSRASVDEQAAPLVDAILGGTLPAELAELRAAAAGISSGAPEEEEEAPPANGGKIERRNVFGAMDLSKLRLKGHVEPTVGIDIPDNLRASILRLVEAQEVEAEEAARAVAEAHGLPYRPHEDSDMDSDDGLPVAKLRLDDGEETGGEEGDESRAASPRPDSRANAAQTLLEIAYLRNPAVFARDAATRRSPARKDLREATGMDDGQIEGWKVMLERNPHKDAILERHQWTRGGAGAGGEKTQGGGQGGSQGGGSKGGRGGKGKGGGGRDGAGGGGSGGSGGGRGGQGGRGRANKGSRGHSNAARTRGHDRKLQRMGAGL